jgi:hypothetical protein
MPGKEKYEVRELITSERNQDIMWQCLLNERKVSKNGQQHDIYCVRFTVYRTQVSEKGQDLRPVQ